MIGKTQTMSMPGGNVDLYKGDGRLRMARELEEAWPGVVTVYRRFGRPQHKVDWKPFDTQLRRRTDIDWDAMPKTNEFGLRIVAKKEVRAKGLHDIVAAPNGD